MPHLGPGEEGGNWAVAMNLDLTLGIYIGIWIGMFLALIVAIRGGCSKGCLLVKAEEEIVRLKALP